MRSTLLFFLCCALPCLLLAQDLPQEVSVTPDGRLVRGGNPTTGFYDPGVVNKLEILLTEPDWFEILDGPGGGGPGGGGPGGNNEGDPLVGTLIFNDDIVLDSVLVSIKGETSDFQNNSEKKSFSIQIDEFREQDLFGYDNLNLNGGFQDFSSMREVLFYDLSRDFNDALKGNFVDVYINGDYWGPYNNIQQIEGVYIREWFLNNDGTRWRAKRLTTGGGGPGGGGGGGGGNFGAGTSSLNYNGPDSSDYNTDYTLKRTEKGNPWEDLIQVTEPLNNEPIEDLYDALNPVMDIDRTLWFLAQEVVFSDDDSYINKGGSDYYVYWDEATNRLFPMEVDGNSVMLNSHVNWSPFYKENNDDFPLMNRLLQNTEIRQRYLAHLRTILAEHFVESEVHDRIDEFALLLDQRIQDDPKKIYSYPQYLNGVIDLKQFVTNRIDYLAGHNEIDRQGVDITGLSMSSPNGANEAPAAGEAVQITTTIDGATQRVLLYYGLGLDGRFERTELFDDGQHNDGAAGDGTYGADIPGQNAGTYVRYYVEAVADDVFGTATYFPAMAERETYLYRVEVETSGNSDVTINELVASNDSGAQDAAGNFEDWIELYNTGSESVDLSGYYLSDDEGELTKWQFPDNTVIGPDSYLIVWTDDDDNETTEDELHTNFKLSASGESLLFANADQELIEQIDFGEQTTNVAYARAPNGTGDFVFKAPTFNENNDTVSNSDDPTAALPEVRVYPNPANDLLTVEFVEAGTGEKQVALFDALGRSVLRASGTSDRLQLEVSGLPEGLYLLSIDGRIGTRVLVVR